MVHNAWRILLTTCVAFAALPAVPSLAASQNEVVVAVEFDGTADFDLGEPAPSGVAPEPHTPGRDGGPTNGVVRTWDNYGVRIDWNINEAATTGALLTVELPDHSVWNPDASGIFSGCDPDVSTISEDGHTLVCALVDRPEGSHGTIRPIATLREASDNSTFTVDVTLTTADDATGVSDSLDQPLTVSEAPAGDWLKIEPLVSEVVNNGTEDGQVVLFPLTLADHSTRTNPPKGAGPINDDDPISFFDHAWNLTPSARIATAAELTAAGFAGAPCGPYAGDEDIPITSETWTCDPTVSPNGYPVVPITVSNVVSRSAPDTNADGSTNALNVVASGQIGFWLTRAEIDAAILDPADGSTDGTTFDNTISLDPPTTAISRPDNITPITVPGTTGPADERFTHNNTATTAVSVNDEVNSDNQIHRFNHWGRFNRPHQAMSSRVGDNQFNYTSNSATWAEHRFSSNNWQGDGEVSRNTPLSMELALHTNSLDRSDPIHGCMAWRNDHIDLVQPPTFTTFTSLGLNSPRFDDTTANYGAAQVYYGRSTGQRLLGYQQSVPFPPSIEDDFELVVEFASSATPFSIDVADNGQTCNNSDADERGWVASTEDLSAFETSPGKYGDINLVRVRTEGEFPWYLTWPEIEDRPFLFESSSTIHLVLWGAAGAVLEDNPNGSTLYLHTSRASGDWDPTTQDAPPNQSCLGDDWDSTLPVPDNGWCSQSYTQAQELDPLTLTDLDYAGFTANAFNSSFLFMADSDHDKLTIVDATPRITKLNVNGNNDVKDNGQLVQFTLQPSIVGSDSEALTNVRITDDLPDHYKFVRMVTPPSSPGSSCVLPEVGTSGVLTCQFSEPDPAVDSDPNLPAGLPGGWSDSLTIEVEVSDAVANPVGYRQLTNLATINTDAIGPWNPATSSFDGDLVTSPADDADMAFSFLPLRSDEGLLMKAIAEEEGPCVRHPNETTLPAGWGERCSVISLDDDNSNAPDADGDGNIHFTLSYTNTGNTVLTDLRFVDVFPYNGDDVEPASDSVDDGVNEPTLGDGRSPASDFSGTVHYVSLTGADSVWVSADDPATISRDPNRAITDTTWCDGIGGTVQNPGNSGSGTCPTDASAVTATYSTTGSLNPGQTVSQSLVLDSEGAACDDIWTNTFGARVAEINLPIRSNDVSVMVRCPMWDLALVKDLADGQSAVVDPSADPLLVTYNIIVSNQGTMSAHDITVVDTPPTGFTYATTNPTTPQNIGGSEVDYVGDGSFVVDQLAPNEQISFPVVYQIDPEAASQGSMTNSAEISSFTDEDGATQADVDSTPDTDPANDLYTDPETGEEADGGESPSFDPDEDGDLNNTNGIDEDDHDTETIRFGYRLGNQVWNDANNNGIVDEGEEPIAGVTLRLFVDADGDGVPDDTNGDGIIDANDAQATTETDSNGHYLFTNLPAGRYIVGVDSANGNQDGPLEGLRSSEPTSVNPNDDVDNDDNGTPNPNGFVYSGTVALGGTEPTGEDGETGDGVDPYSNLTVDFGFYQPNFDLALRKTLADNTPETVTVGDEVTFDITVINQGDVAADRIAVIDYLPAQLELADDDWALQSDGSATTTVDVSLAPGEQTTVPITTRVVADGDIENTAEITQARPIDVYGAELRAANGGPLFDIDSIADANDDDSLTDDEVANANDDEDDHDMAAIRAAAAGEPPVPTTLPYTGGNPGPVAVFGITLLAFGVAITRLRRSARAVVA